MTTTETSTICSKYESGYSIGSLSEKFELTPDEVVATLIAGGAALRIKGKIPRDQVVKIFNLYREAKSLREIESLTGVALSTVSRVIRRDLGLPKRESVRTSQLTSAQKTALISMYLNGNLSVRAAGEKFGVSYFTALAVIRKAHKND